MKPWESFKYKNLSLFIASLGFAFFISRYEPFHTFLLHLGNFGYIGAFFAGTLFVSTFTVASGVVIFLVLAESLSPIEIGLIAGLGAVAGDFIIFRFIKDDLSYEIKSIYEHIDGNHHLTRLLHTKFFSWTLPVIGTIIIASPFPDEIGVSLMGITKMKTYKFLLISFILNALGIFLVISASLVVKP